MKKFLQFAFIMIFLFTCTISYAGNPDRQGEAGAAELLLNPWARSAGFHSMNTASVFGVEAMRINVAGIGRIENRELRIGNARLYDGSSLGLNALGYAQKSKNGKGAFAISLNAVDFGDIQITTTDLPEGTGGTYSPGFFNLGIGYARTYDNKISVGILFRFVSEALPSVNATGFALDAGVQYVSGEKDNFRLGISLRNIGTPMSFGGEGLAIKNSAPDGQPYELTFSSRSQKFEMPSLLAIGISYDFYFAGDLRFRTLGNFTSNAFSKDQIGGGAELTFKEKFSVRAAYKIEAGTTSGAVGDNIYSGLSFGATAMVPLKKSSSQMIGIDYAYRSTDPFRGTHNFSLVFAF